GLVRSWWKETAVGAVTLAAGVALAVAATAAGPPPTDQASRMETTSVAPAATSAPSGVPTPSPSGEGSDDEATPSTGGVGGGAGAGLDAVPAADVATAIDAAPTHSALGALGTLEVKGRAPKTGYDRDLFAYRSVDLDRNGCDTRNDILNRDLVRVTHRPGSGGCTVESGVLEPDPSSGSVIPFTRGTATSNDVQIDHVVALSNAWQTGAAGWDSGTRERFGNDPLNLLAVSGPLNSQKGDGDAATWLPPNK